MLNPASLMPRVETIKRARFVWERARERHQDNDFRPFLGANIGG